MKEFLKQLLFFMTFLLLPMTCFFRDTSYGTDAPQWFDKRDSMEHLSSIHSEHLLAFPRGFHVTHNGIPVEYKYNPYPSYRFAIIRADGFFRKRLVIERMAGQTREDSFCNDNGRETVCIVAVEDPKTWKDGSQAVLFSNGEVIRFANGALLKLEETGIGRFHKGSKHYEPWVAE